jgi:hypothetical protein
MTEHLAFKTAESSEKCRFHVEAYDVGRSVFGIKSDCYKAVFGATMYGFNIRLGFQLVFQLFNVRVFRYLNDSLAVFGFFCEFEVKSTKRELSGLRYRVFAYLKQQTRPNLLEWFHLFRAYEFNEVITNCLSLVPWKNRRDSA